MVRSRLPRAARPDFAHLFKSPVLESLEVRRLMSVAPVEDPAVDNNPPRVVAVFANSTAWTPTFRAALEDQHQGSTLYGFETDGVSMDAGQNFREHVLPWFNLNQVSIQFDENVSVQQDDLTITGVNQTAYATTAFTYDPAAFTATWTLDAPVRNDVLTLRLEGNSDTGVTDLAGNPLQGNCPDGDADNTGDGGTVGEGGNPGRDFCEVLPILAGDVTRDGRVNALDLAAVRSRLNTSATGSNEGPRRYSIFADVTGDGRINALDLAAVRSQLNSRLPESENAATGVLST